MYNLGDTLTEVHQNKEAATKEAIEYLWAASERLVELKDIDARYTKPSDRAIVAALQLQSLIMDSI